MGFLAASFGGFPQFAVATLLNFLAKCVVLEDSACDMVVGTRAPVSPAWLPTIAAHQHLAIQLILSG
jgi:hypothetical protein